MTKSNVRSVGKSFGRIIIVQGKHEAIIPEEDFNLADEKLKLRRIEIRRKRSDYPLSGILYCAKCNHRYLGISSISNHRTGEKKRWYRCSGPYRSFIKCKNKSVKAENIEPKVAALLDCLLRSKTLKSSRWTTGILPGGANFPNFGENTKIDATLLRNKLDNNHKKQAKLTDAYLENLLGEDVFRGKIEELRSEEDDLKKLLAGIELLAIERERSEGYENRVKDFLEGYDDGLTKVSFEHKRQMAGLLFKNIPSLFLEQEKNEKCLKNQRLTTTGSPQGRRGMKNLRPESISAHLADFCLYLGFI